MTEIRESRQLDQLNFLMKGAGTLYAGLKTDYLLPMGFELEEEQGDDRLIWGPDRKIYSVTFRLNCWKAADYGRWIWFELDSQIPHASSIVAAIGLGNSDAIPFYVMNLISNR